MAVFFSYNRLLYLIIFLVGALNYALMLGTLNLVEGYYPIFPSLDLLRSESSFFLFLGFLTACYLIESNTWVWPRRVFFTALLLLVLLIAHMAAVLAQLTTEAGPMHKVLFYVNYLKWEWLNDQRFELILLYIFPGFLLLLLALVYLSCMRDEVNGPWLKQQFHKYFGFAVFFLVLGFIPPLQQQMPYSLSHNALLYLVKTGYFPQQDIYQHDTDAEYSDWQLVSGNSANSKNVVLVILESTQKKAVYVPHSKGPLKDEFYKGISPYLSELSKESVVFDQTFGSAPHTSKALVGIHCGVLPYLDLAIFESVYDLPVDCLPELMEQVGYQTVFMQGATSKYENRRELLKVFGYQTIVTAEDLLESGWQRNNPLGFEDKVLVDEAGKWLKKNGESPFFMSLLTLTPHHPYLAPQGFKKEQYLEDELENNYLNSVRYQDEFIEDLITLFKESGLYENTVFVFVSDHGEAFGEHGEQLHNNVAYNEVAQVFLMVHDGSGELKEGVVSESVSQLQIVPAVFELLGMDVSNPKLASSFFKQRGEAYGSCYERIMCFYYADNDYKYVLNFREKPPELFDLKNDPKEIHNLYEDKPELAAQMHEKLMNYYNFHQSAMHNYYSRQNPDYLEELSKAVLYSLEDMKESFDQEKTNADE